MPAVRVLLKFEEGRALTENFAILIKVLGKRSLQSKFQGVLPPSHIRIWVATNDCSKSRTWKCREVTYKPSERHDLGNMVKVTEH